MSLTGEMTFLRITLLTQIPEYDHCLLIVLGISYTSLHRVSFWNPKPGNLKGGKALLTFTLQVH